MVNAQMQTAANYARALLAELGVAHLARPPAPAAEHPALAAARSGLPALTGCAEGPPQLLPVPLAACADGVLAALDSLAPAVPADGLRGAELLGERAAVAGYHRNGATSPGGSCRLLHTADGLLAVNLARDDDWHLLPAWLEQPVAPDWEALAAALATLPGGQLVERGRLLGLPLAEAGPPPPAPVPWHQTMFEISNGVFEPRATAPLVVDLSSLWAGPLCGHLLQRMGARVLKVESRGRPDGARGGPPLFYALLNAGKASVALNFDSAAGREQLRQLLLRADIVIEASRPRALRQLGCDAAALIEANPRLTWISITGYGRGDPEADWIAFGDDAGVAAGLSYLLRQLTGEALFCGDAIADPLTGLHAALLAWSSYRRGGGRLLALALRDVAAHCLQWDLPSSAAALRAWRDEWQAQLEAAGAAPGLPRVRRPAGTARALGADTEAVLAELGIPC